jgi:hypothetical protein
VGQLGPDDAAADAQGHVVRLVAEALGKPDSPAHQVLEIQVYDRLLLTAYRTLCDQDFSLARQPR